MPLQYTCDACHQPLTIDPLPAGSPGVCPHCRHQFIVPTIGVAMARPLAKRRKKQDPTAAIFLGIGLVVIGLACGGILFSAFREKPRDPDAWESIESELRERARDEVRNRLKYPDNATFRPAAEAMVEKPGERGHYIVTGKVDAMNGFGAKPTVPWRCVFALRDTKPRTWELQSVSLGEDVLFERARPEPTLRIRPPEEE